jgi:hypothetical protein
MRGVQAVLRAGLMLAALAGPARAMVGAPDFAVHTAADLARLCTADPREPYGTAALNFCQGFTTGAFRVLYDMQTAMGHATVCLPVPNPTRSEVTAAFGAWVLADPARRASPAEDALLAFLSSQYPCAAGVK